MRIAAERALRHAPILEAPHSMWEEFAARFPYEETEDQLAAIADVVADLEKGSPMDRLICGDVGFGKTEVAMRAAFVAAMAGMQVAVICRPRCWPASTTAALPSASGLSGQRRPSRALSAPRRPRLTREGMADGTVDIVVGTHALLAKGGQVQEPRPAGHRRGAAFRRRPQGAAEGDARRNPCADADRDADPAHAATALTGVRDLSIIATPPVDRLAIRTFIANSTADHPRGAAARALPRRAGVLCGAAHRTCPRSKDFLRDPCAGGQLRRRPWPDGGGRDRRHHERSSTTASMTCCWPRPSSNPARYPDRQHADRAPRRHVRPGQLYQIRGRVGRAKTRAYCYLTTPPRR
jgi:transcription-repair coupling factor (superfamily II helicase)